MNFILCALGVAGLVAAAGSIASTEGEASYRQVGAVALGAPERWDYVVANAPSGRVFVAHGDRMSVVDSHALHSIGEVTGMTGGAHGAFISNANGLGFTDDGGAGKVIAFDLKTLEVRKVLDAAPDADAIAGDDKSVYVVDGDSGVITVVDQASPKVVATTKVGGSLEYAGVDGRGHLFVNGAERSEIVRIDTASNAVSARWPIPDCKSPHGMAVDPQHHRLFTSCVNGRLDVVDTDSGREVASVPIGLGTDAAAFDPVRHRIFSSNGRDGDISVIEQVDANTYRLLAPIKTQVGARTMAVDVSTGRLFVATADVDPAGPTTGRRRFLPGTLKLLVFDPVR